MSDLFNSEPTTKTRPPRRIFIWLIPVFLVVVLVILFLAGSWKTILPAKEVDVARARIGEASAAVNEGETLFQAAGWIQADPYAVSVTALISGIVEKIHVIDGEKIKKDQVLVEIVDDDFKLDLAKAEARITELSLEMKNKQLMKLANEAELKQLDSLEETAKALAKRIKHKADSYRNAKDALPIFDTEQAELEYREQLKKIDEFTTKKQVIQAEIDLSQNAVEMAAARVDTQKVVIDKIKLDLSRTKIVSPVDGIIEKMFAREGRKQMLGSDNEYSTTVAKIFQPNHIQVRVDVPLVDVPKVKVGQKAEVHLEVIDKPLTGFVKSIGGQADYQKNTLEVNVKIPGGHPDLRPEMLAQVKFLSDKQPVKTGEGKVSGTFIKKEAVIDGFAWIVTSDMKLEKRAVQVGKSENEGWVQVISGINAGEKAVVNPSTQIKEGISVKLGRVYE